MKRKFWNWVRNEGERTLFLNGEISDETWYGDEVTPKLFKDELLSGEGDITVWINSPGGDVFAAAQIYNILMDYKGNVTVKIDGLAASAASVIAMAGTKVLMSPVAMMIHNPTTIAIGDTAEMKKAIEMLDEVKESIMNSFHTNTRATKWLSSDSNLQKLAKAEAECMASYYGVTKKEETALTKIMGNAVATVEQMTAYIKAKKAFVYSIPIPIEFHEKSLKRKLTVTLAYLSPIHPSSIKYREKQVWVTINNGNSLIGSRAEYDYHTVQRGTLQHEIFENDSIEVWDIDQSIELKVNCRGCASENNPEMLIPYALFATFEMAPDCGVDVYQKVVDKVQVKNAIKTV